jgi:outer membrane protein assembly factor BamB
MSLLLALALATQPLIPALHPVPARFWTVAWERQLVPASLLEYRPQELGGPSFDPVTGVVVVGTRDGWLHAYDQDGHRLWEYQAGGRFDAPPRIDGGTVYAGSADGRLYALGLGDGKLKWSYDAHEEVGTTPVVAGDRVLVMTLQDTLLAVDAKSGAWLWHHRREPKEGFTIRGAASVQVGDGRALGAYSDGTVVALDLATGAVRWERKIAPAGNFMDVDSLCLDGGRLYAAAYSGAVYGIDVATGRELWELRAPGASRVALGGGTLVVETTTQLIGVSPGSGATRWTRKLEGTPWGEISVAGGRAAVPEGAGLSVIDVATGQLLRVFDPGTGVSATAAWRDGRAYVLSNSGALFALDMDMS